VWRKACLLSLLAAVLVLLMSRQASATGSLSGVLETASQNHLFWYLSRTSAFLAYILLFINIVFGLGLKTKFLDKLSARWQSFDLHQFSALLAMAMITLHIFSLLGDQYMSPTLSDLLIPMSASYRPIWTALGILSFYVLIIIVLSSYLKRFIGQKIWRMIHMLSFVLFYVILYHGLRSGSDTQTWWAQLMYVSTGSAAAFLFLWRFLLAGPAENDTSITRQTAKDIPRQSPGNTIK
jgi:sulfoxide reductase heme-binding subunit YedZ